MTELFFSLLRECRRYNLVATKKIRTVTTSAPSFPRKSASSDFRRDSTCLEGVKIHGEEKVAKIERPLVEERRRN